MKKLAVLYFVFLIASAAVYGDTKVANDPTRISVGARPLGMGKAYVGVADDISSLFLNPAGLASANNWQITSMQGKFINEVNYINLGTAFPTKYGVFGLGYTNSGFSFTAPALTYEVIDGIRVLPSSTEGVAYNYGNSAMLLAYGSQLPWIEGLTAGATLKMFSQSLSGTGTDGTGTGYDLDLGLAYKPNPALKLGAVAQNVLPASMGGVIKWGSVEESLPVLTKWGFGLKILGEQGLRQLGSHELSLNFDYDWAATRSTVPGLYHAGLEWSPIDVLDLRLGVDQDYVGSGAGLLQATNNLTSGVSFYYNAFRFDYAYHTYSDLTEDTTHYFSLSYGVYKKPPVVKVKKADYIMIKNPADRDVVYNDEINIDGNLDKDAAKLFINGKEVTVLPDTSFTFKSALVYGLNTFEFKAFDKESKLLQEKKLRAIRLVSFVDVTKDYWARGPIEQLATLQYVTGYPDGTFGPEKSITRAELATLMVKLNKGKTIFEADKPPFKDVPLKHWAVDYINMAVVDGLITGYPDNAFRPNNPITRAEGVAVIARFAGVTIEAVEFAPFPDLPGRHWAAPEVNAAKANGLINYLAGKMFEPKRKMTRAEAAEVLARTPFAAENINKLMGLVP